MEITEVRVFPVQEEKLKAFVSVVFDRCFMVNDIKVIQGREGLFISMPSRKKKNGEFKDVAHPLNNETRRMIETQILDEYERALAERGESAGEPADTLAAYEAASPSGNGHHPPVARPVLAAMTPAVVAPPALVSPPVAAEAAEEAEGGRSLEEIQELHLRDSFWTFT